ncbi:rhodanese-like domain-containing protein [Domibacillus sp. DTU_2020_1001157_1_SI_ALB_TIR_016]|uniref:rhodanese-like domain-containing protein n=1 Tax=Domibacillus sp. DTU_2020_1001157_1_SI_ALB_TIR_016 TaxID=3077789 RepID=UPI0028E2A1D9|nr:rhodanese-like domain-containing protein [Domibacillus sp. DTU_2020_1001157_1_SI_ALB_TIR_016]WNS79256.1 rhodanese-like domain-containing protein [Domibacillus sp. DTU_2020_1001157_1_SI_ALB_TIR_016]
MKQMLANEVETLRNQGKELSIIDVRETDEVAAGKIPGAVNIPLGLLEFRLQDLDKSEEHIVVCRSGGRSSMAANLLEERGYKVINMAGGMNEWQGPTE